MRHLDRGARRVRRLAADFHVFKAGVPWPTCCMKVLRQSRAVIVFFGGGLSLVDQTVGSHAPDPMLQLSVGNRQFVGKLNL